ncbi:MAG: hypothetical protein HFG29_10735 [Eubacterium sp.]|jgi:hypothetical protein|nr:hypothetical protein [Clostridia bacterium]MCI8957421.1 hypothetical protein [Eubacterium sp.]
MTKEQFKAESSYRVSMAVVGSMLKNGLLTKKEYDKIDTIMLKKYQPILGSLQV